MSSCVEWAGAISGDGYGSAYVNKKQISAHRHAYQKAFGDIPVGMWVLHKCDNPLCVNPEHLFLGTPKDNIQDCINKGRRNTPMGSSHWNRKLDEDAAKRIRGLAKTIMQEEIAKEFHVSVATISNIVRGKSWKHAA